MSGRIAGFLAETGAFAIGCARFPAGAEHRHGARLPDHLAQYRDSVNRPVGRQSLVVVLAGDDAETAGAIAFDSTEGAVVEVPRSLLDRVFAAWENAAERG